MRPSVLVYGSQCGFANLRVGVGVSVSAWVWGANVLVTSYFGVCNVKL